MSDLAVVIPNWNGKNLLKACLDSLQTQTRPVDIIVVDNGSHDGSVEYITKHFPKVQIVGLNHNHGFAGGVNAGIKAAIKQGYKYVALLNNDAVADKNWAQALINHAGRHREVGIINSKILHSNKQRIDTTGDQYSIWGTPFPRGRGELDKGQYDSSEQRDILAACGGASLYRVATLKQIGLFDEKYFAYYEDTDISLRVRLAGWQIHYSPTARVYHQIGATSSKLGDFRQYHMFKNYFFLYFKNMPGWLVWKYLLTAGTGFGGRMITLLTQGKFKLVFKALLVILVNLPALFWQRFNIQRHRKISSAAFDQMLWHKPSPEQAKRIPFRWFYKV